MKTILDEAYQNHYGVPALPAYNETLVRAAIEAAAQARSPVILLMSNEGDPYFICLTARYFAEKYDVDTAICLDHSRTFEDSVLGMRMGVTAIMADRSTLPYEENAGQVRELAQIAHAAGISIEGELGHVGVGLRYDRDGSSALTEPDSAKRYFEDTGVDALAVAIGTAHGVYAGVPKLDFGRLAEINDACGRPLALHGGSGSGEDNINRACKMGVAKVNIVTDVLTAARGAALDGDFSGNAVHRFFPALHEAAFASALHMFSVTGSAGMARTQRRAVMPARSADTSEV